MVVKLSSLRIFADADGKMNRSLLEVAGQALVVSQFTLLGDTTKGRRPSFDGVAPPGHAQVLYDRVVAGLKAHGIGVETGVFGAHMLVSLQNDGPVTFVVETRPGRPDGI
jgi:D-tyrosyl-tRNA(Tyr) deacylase